MSEYAESSTEAAAERISEMRGDVEQHPDGERTIGPETIEALTMDEAADLIEQRRNPEAAKPKPRPEPEPVAAAPAPSRPAQPVMPQELQQARDHLVREQEAFDEKWKATDWTRLRQEDPAEWAAKRQEHNAEKREIDERTRQLTQAAEQAWRAQQAEAQAHYETFLAQQRRELTRARPSFEKDRDHVVKYLQNVVGFTETELSAVADHRLLVMAHDAWQFHNGGRKGSGNGIRVPAKRRAAPRISKAEAVTKAQGHTMHSVEHAANRIAEKMGRL